MCISILWSYILIIKFIEFNSLCLYCLPKYQFTSLTLKASIATKVVCFCHLLKCFRSLFYNQCRPRSDCYGSTLFASTLTLVNNVSKYLQQTTFSDAIYCCGSKGYRPIQMQHSTPLPHTHTYPATKTKDTINK